MGAECSAYKDYELDEPIESSSADWTLYPAHTRGDKPPLRRVTVFVHKKSKKERKQGGHGYQKSSQFLKVLRHPAILKYYSSHDGPDEVAMVTEPVEPLEYVLADLSEDEIIAGVYNVVQALEFLHDKGGLSHNNVGLASVYVSVNDGSWKLGGMQCVCKFSEVNNKFLEATKPLRDSKSITPEEKDGKVDLASGSTHSLDAYGFGMLVSDVLDSRPDIAGSSSDRFGELMQSSFLHHEPKMRPRLCSLINDDFFSNSYLEVVSFLSNITIKGDIEKEKFFSTLVSKLQSVSCDVVAKRLLSRLLCRFVLAEPSAEKEFLPHIFSPGNGEGSDNDNNIHPILPMNLFKDYCVPILSKLWSIKDVHIRLILLKFFPLFASAYDNDTLETFILPQMLIGLRDTDDTLVSGTFHALAALVPILGGEVVVGGERQKFFTEGRPKFSLGSSPQIKHNSFSTSSFDQKQKAQIPINVLDALHMENKLRPREEKPPQEVNNKEKEIKEQKRQKQKQDMERKREQLRKEREMKRVQREQEREEREQERVGREQERVGREQERVGREQEMAGREQERAEDAKKTLLEVAKERESVETEPEVKPDSNDSLQSEELEDEEVFEDWEDFSTPLPVPESPPVQTKLKTSPTRFHSSSTSNFDINDMDFTPSQNTSTRTDRDLISWDSNDVTSEVHKPEMASTSREQKPSAAGKGMKLSSKKSSPRSTKSNVTGDLGSMFEIPDITVKAREPDFFAGMQPELEFKRYDGGVGGGTAKSNYSDKLNVENMAQIEAGWDEDNWTDFD